MAKIIFNKKITVKAVDEIIGAIPSYVQKTFGAGQSVDVSVIEICGKNAMVEFCDGYSAYISINLFKFEDAEMEKEKNLDFS